MSGTGTMKSSKKLAFQQLKKNKIAIIGLIIIISLAFIALFAPFIAPHDPIEQNLEKRLLPPCR